MMDWLDVLAVQGTLKSLLQHHSSKASILRHSAFYIVQLSHPYMTTGKSIAWLDGPLLAKSLFFNMLSMLVITFLPRSKCHFISWLLSPSAVILDGLVVALVVFSSNKLAHFSHFWCFQSPLRELWFATETEQRCKKLFSFSHAASIHCVFFLITNFLYITKPISKAGQQWWWPLGPPKAAHGHGLGPRDKDRKGWTGLAGTLQPTGEPEQMLLGLKEEAFQKQTLARVRNGEKW